MRRADPDLQARRRGEILAAAERCFAARGFHATSMDEVAAEAGVSLGLLYRYFANKDALVLAAAARDGADALAALTALEESADVVEALVALVRGELERELDPARARIATEILAEATRNEAMAARLIEEDRAIRGALVRALRRHQRAGRLRKDVDLGAFADVLAALFDGLPVRAQIFSDFDARACAKLVERVIRAVLTNEDGDVPSPVTKSARPRKHRA